MKQHLLIAASLIGLVCGFGLPGAVHAQTMSASVVASCGSVTYPAGYPYPTTQDTTGKFCNTGGGGGGGGAVTLASGAVASGAYSSGSIASGAFASGAISAGALAAGSGVDGWNLTEGAKADAAWTTGSGSIVAVLKALDRDTLLNASVTVTSLPGSPMQTTGGTVGLVASMAAIGNVGGFDTVVSVTPTIQNAAYASGNCMGGFQTAGIARTSGGAGVLNYINLISTGGGTTALQVYVLSANPTGSTCTDKGTFTIVAADQSKVIATFSLTPAAPTGSTWTEAEQTVMAKSFTTTGSANVYFAIVSGGTWTPASTTDLKVVFGATQD